MVLVKFLYKHHQPKNPLHHRTYENTDNWDADEIKQALRKAVCHYHPDKAIKYGKKIYYLYENITQRLTARYEYRKG